MEPYPFSKIVQEKVKALNRNVAWLVGQIDKSESWFWKIKSITEIQLGVIESISKNIEFDILVDYYQWLQNHGENKMSLLKESSHDYKRSRKISIQLTVTGDKDTLSTNLGKVIDIIQKEGDRSGFDIE